MFMNFSIFLIQVTFPPKVYNAQLRCCAMTASGESMGRLASINRLRTFYPDDALPVPSVCDAEAGVSSFRAGELASSASVRDSLAEKILVMAQELKPSLAPEQVRSDGNCFFRALGFLMDNEEIHARVRAEIIAEADNNPARYDPFVENLKEWTASMSTDAIWADGIAVKAAANVYAPTVVFRKNAPSQVPSVFVPEDPSLHDKAPLYLELDETSSGAEHYSPMVIKRAAAADTASSEALDDFSTPPRRTKRYTVRGSSRSSGPS